MSQPVISTTTQRRAICGTLDEALTLAGTQAREVDAWAGCSISISPVMRDHTSGTFQWEVMVAGNPVQLNTPTNAAEVSSYPPATPTA